MVNSKMAVSHSEISNINQKRGKRLLVELLCCLAAFFPRALMILHAYPLRYVSDEVATVSGAALLAGYDWSSVVSHAGYYGQGWYCLFWWVFRLTDDPIRIQHTILYICAAVQTTTVPIVFHIAERFYHLNSLWKTAVLAVFASLLTVTRTTVLFNENNLNPLCWVIVLILLEAASEKSRKKQAKWCILLFAVLFWGLLMHLRLAVLMIALVLSFFLMEIFCWKKWKAFLLLVPLAAVYLGARRIVTLVQSLLWKPQAGQTLRNASTGIHVSADTSDPIYARTLADIVMGQIGTYLFFSCGLALAGAIFVVVWCHRRRKSGIKSEIVFVLLTFLLATLGMIAAIALQWGNSAYENMAEGVTDTVYAYKAFTVIRYFGIYAGPFTVLGLLCGFQLEQENQNENVLWKSQLQQASQRNQQRMGRILQLVFLLVIFAIILYWIMLIQPYIGDNWFAREPFVGITHWKVDHPYAVSPFLIGFGILAAFALISSFFLFAGKSAVVVAVAAIILMYSHVETAYCYDYPEQEAQYYRVDDSAAFLKATAGEDSMKQTVYCSDLSGATDHNSWYMLQFCLPRWKVIPVGVDDVITSGIVQANSADYDPTGGSGVPYERITLDDVHGEYIYLVGEDTISRLGEQ